MNSQIEKGVNARKTLFRITIVIIFILCIGLIAGKVYLNNISKDWDPLTTHIYQPMPTPGSSLDLIETDGDIKIPANARDIYAFVSGFR